MSGTEDMKDSVAYCPHKESVDGYCKSCTIYLCHKCQLEKHYEHIQDIVGLDSLFSEAMNEYTVMSSELQKNLLAGAQCVKEGAIDEALLQVEKRISEEYDKLIKDVKEIEEEQAATIRSTPYLAMVQEEKQALEGEEQKRLTEFDKKLGSTITQLLSALSEDKYENVGHLVTESAKEQFTKEAQQFEPYYEKQKEFLKHLEVIKAVKPKLVCNSQTISDLVVVKGVHEDIVRLLLWDNKTHSVYIQNPKEKTVMKHIVNNVSIPKKHANVVVEEQMLIICGGKKKPSTYYKNTYLYSGEENKMISREDMIYERAYHGIANRKDAEIYVVGGEAKTGLLGSAEVYDFKNNKWTELPTLVKRRKNPAVCICGDKYLYAIGGAGVEPDSSVEMLAIPDGKAWELKKVAVGTELVKAGAVQLADTQILVFGGKKQMSSFIYDFANGTFTAQGTLAQAGNFSRSDTRKVEGLVYATGNKKVTTHVYDISTSKWSVIPEKEFRFKYSWDEPRA